MTNRLAATLSAVLALNLAGTRSEAWEQDVHYGLTKCLALKADFTLTEAERLALANQSLDDHRETAATWLVGRYIVVGQSDTKAAQASLFVWQHHFPSDIKPPAAPDDRIVVPQSSTSKLLISLSHGPDQFGMALHAFQDSWSHRDVPDIPLRNWGPLRRPELSWSHPADRGGWWRHEADITYLPYNVSHTLAMAKETFRVLLRSRGKDLTNFEQTWQAMHPKIAEFARAATKTEKRKWFSQYCGFNDFRFLAGINIKDGDGFEHSQRKSSNHEGESVKVKLTANKVPAGLWEFSRTFLEDWLVRRRNLDALLEAVDVGSVARQYLGDRPANEEDRNLVRKLLVMWLMEDHGLVEAWGHGMPDSPDFERFPTTFDNLGGERRLAAYTSLQQALKVDAEGVAVELIQLASPVLSSNSEDAEYAAIFQISHLARDTIMLLIDHRDAWKITGILWSTS